MSEHLYARKKEYIKIILDKTPFYLKEDLEKFTFDELKNIINELFEIEKGRIRGWNGVI